MLFRHLLLAILIYGVLSIWVTGRWTLSGLEAAVFLCAIWLALRTVWGKVGASVGVLPLLVAAMCFWGLLQLMAGWTVVAADTAEAVRYWLAAACLVWLGHQEFAQRQARH